VHRFLRTDDLVRLASFFPQTSWRLPIDALADECGLFLTGKSPQLAIRADRTPDRVKEGASQEGLFNYRGTLSFDATLEKHAGIGRDQNRWGRQAFPAKGLEKIKPICTRQIIIEHETASIQPIRVGEQILGILIRQDCKALHLKGKFERNKHRRVIVDKNDDWTTIYV
jgi:hypothetical protein